MENGSIAIETKFDTIHHAFSKYCADLRPITHVFSQIESLHMPLLVMLPEDIQSMLVHSTNFGGLSLLSIIFLSFIVTTLFLILSTIIIKVDKHRKASNVCLNQAIINLELKIKTLQFEKETFRTKIVELESELDGEKTKIEDLKDKVSINDTNCATISELKKQLSATEAEIETLKREKSELSTKIELDSQKFVEAEKKIRNLYDEKQMCEAQIEELKKNSLVKEEEIVQLKSEIELKEKSIEALQIKNDALKDENAKIVIDGKLETEIETSAKDFKGISKAFEESLVRIKELELKLKLMDELRKKDLELNVKACSELDAQLKKKSTDAEKAQHFLDQLKVKQERIFDLESQLTRVEKKSTLERQQFEKQAHENWLSARKYEKEAKEAKQEAKVWKDKYSEVEKFKENSLIRPVALEGPHEDLPMNQSLNLNEERNERPASVVGNPVFIPGQFIGVSQTPMAPFMKPLAPLVNMFPRPPFPPMPFPMCSPFGDNRNTPSPEVMTMMANYSKAMMPMPPSSLVSPPMNLYSNSTSSMPNLSQISPFAANNDSTHLLNSQSLNFDDSLNNTSNLNDPNPSNSTTSMV